MYADPQQVEFRVWFIPEAGIEQHPTVLGKVTGLQAAIDIATQFVQNDIKAQGSDRSYREMHDYAMESLLKASKSPEWSVIVPVCYGSIAIV